METIAWSLVLVVLSVAYAVIEARRERKAVFDGLYDQYFQSEIMKEMGL